MSYETPVKQLFSDDIIFVFQKSRYFANFGRNKVVFLTKCHGLRSANNLFKVVGRVVARSSANWLGYPVGKRRKLTERGMGGGRPRARIDLLPSPSLRWPPSVRTLPSSLGRRGEGLPCQQNRDPPFGANKPSPPRPPIRKNSLSFHPRCPPEKPAKRKGEREDGRGGAKF